MDKPDGVREIIEQTTEKMCANCGTWSFNNSSDALDQAEAAIRAEIAKESKDRYLTYYVHIPQDPSVGVPDINFNVTIHDFTLEQMVDGCDNGKEEFRKALQEFWGSWFDGKAMVFFENESDFAEIDKGGGMRVLVACEFSGIVREAFRRRGHDAWSCDLLPTEIPGQHIQGDVLGILNDGWDLMIAHPPCTYLTVTGNKWMKPEFKSRFPNREQQRKEAIDFFLKLINAHIKRSCIENPIGIMSSIYRKPDQIIQPFFFGDKERKTTCLWLKNLPKLTPTNIVEPNLYKYKNGHTDGMWHVNTLKLSSLERMKARSKTFQGIAEAMAEQWGGSNGKV